MRYYTLELIPNLFGEWLLIRTYGSTLRLKPTGVICELYNDAHQATSAYEQWVKAKHNKGYCSWRCNLIEK
ncbi:MAG: molybdenum metabolism regulator [Sulfuricurvum sp.]|uniref:molybdenum metabolism regulator n=1 Tax=Sulfuricurvum sp. TaxID=2025608 RepID=UPI00261D30B2|nr:molybdenum metabolism regulator [Sulfuricurvum sp.]MDD2829816.1 molybdenum metabolism regulator [Sulfuricurvum sp.]